MTWNAVRVFAAVLAVGLVGLLIVALTGQRATAFSVNVQALDPVAITAPGQRVCEGPVRIAADTDGLTAWMPAGPTAGVSFLATLQTPGAPQARAILRPTSPRQTSGLAALSGSFAPPLHRGAQVRLCVTSHAGRVIELLGAGARAGSGVLTLGGKPSPYALALVFHSTHPRSVLALLPTMFRRAALFKASWVGAWTFWVLLGAILAAGSVGLAYGLRSAVAADEAQRADD